MERRRKVRGGKILEQENLCGPRELAKRPGEMGGKQKKVKIRPLSKSAKADARREAGQSGEKDGRKEEEMEEENFLKMCFWNVAGLYNKDRQFWKYIERFDFVGLTETWVDETQWDKIEGILPDTFIWRCQLATKEKNKGRASGGIITGVRKGLKEEELKEDERGIQIRKIWLNNKTLKILTLYSREMKKTRDNLEKLTGSAKEERLIVGGDFNARTGTEGSFCGEEKEERIWRKSRDKLRNNEGIKLLEMIEENGWEILNGNMEGDEEGDYTFIGGKGSSVIDYVIVDSEIKDEVKSFKIGTRTESDHFPMEVEVYGERKVKEQERRKEEQWKEK
ncbi:uncharacterized protein LOC112552323, partial [Pogonomyrmex barbatus]|uniref:Uncharacterized protein LOC112552323 n=1 Tax=Pogonomyrmex barbatus TaxID=144034 RepID=A0A8N1S2M5_9HYME